jgi:hypothetical protein
MDLRMLNITILKVMDVQRYFIVKLSLIYFFVCIQLTLTVTDILNF